MNWSAATASVASTASAGRARAATAVARRRAPAPISAAGGGARPGAGGPPQPVHDSQGGAAPDHGQLPLHDDVADGEAPHRQPVPQRERLELHEAGRVDGTTGPLVGGEADPPIAHHEDGVEGGEPE